MADISKISINGTTYNVKDATARSRPQLPSTTSADNGKVLKVVNGAWAKGTDNTGSGSSGLPSVTASDNGKVLKVVSGAWAVGTDEVGSGSGSGSGASGTPVVAVSASDSVLHLNRDVMSLFIPVASDMGIMVMFDDGPGVYHLFADCRTSTAGISIYAASGVTYVGTFPTTAKGDIAELSFLVMGTEGNYTVYVTGCNWEVGT